MASTIWLRILATVPGVLIVSGLSLLLLYRRRSRPFGSLRALRVALAVIACTTVVATGEVLGLLKLNPALPATVGILMPGADHSFKVLMLGGFQLWRSGSEQAGIPRSSQRLLAFLAIHGGMTSRAAVAGTLWPDATQTHACSNLRSALARLNRPCRKMLQVSKLELGLAKDVTVDIRHAQRLARRLLDPAVIPEPSDLSPAAIVILSSDLLPGWYDDWVLAEAEDWRQLRLHALETLATGSPPSAAGVKPRTPPRPPCGRSRSEKAPMLLSSRSTWPRATSRKRCASSHATGRCCTPSLAWSPLCGCVALSRVFRARAGNAVVIGRPITISS